MERTDRVDLAHVPGFALGRLQVYPALRQLVRDDGASEVLQHRVMQVLVALARADGAIVTRDELTMSCWAGRVVGEDAINRILSRLRSVAAGIGAGSFRIETITRIGYRLLRDGQPAAAPALPPRPAAALNRRAWLVGGSAAALVLAAGGAWWFGHSTAGEPGPTPEAAALMQQALLSLRQNTREGHNQAIGLFQRVVALAPDYADGWGALSDAYAAAAYLRPLAESDALRARARAAAGRALALDPDNAYAQVGLAIARPLRGNWFVVEQALRRSVSQHRDNQQLLFTLAALLANVGRNADALPILARVKQLGPPPPDLYFSQIKALWSTNRLEELDRVMAEASAVYPTHFAIWFMRFYVPMYSGRPGAAIALGANREQRPTGIPESEFDAVLHQARALESRAPAEIESALAEQMRRAHQGSGRAENAIQFASALGRLDEAFAVAEAYYFNRGFTIPDLRFSIEEGTYSPLRDRPTGFLFYPPVAAMRADPRFEALMNELGLTRYWAESGSQPDYRRG